MAKTKVTKASRIRGYLRENPKAKQSEIAKALKVKINSSELHNARKALANGNGHLHPDWKGKKPSQAVDSMAVLNAVNKAGVAAGGDWDRVAAAVDFLRGFK